MIRKHLTFPFKITNMLNVYTCVWSGKSFLVIAVLKHFEDSFSTEKASSIFSLSNMLRLTLQLSAFSFSHWSAFSVEAQTLKRVIGECMHWENEQGLRAWLKNPRKTAGYSRHHFECLTCFQTAHPAPPKWEKSVRVVIPFSTETFNSV